MEKINWAKVSKISVLVVIAFLLLIDIPPFLNDVEGDTVSEQINALGKEYMMFTFLVGFTMGHFFWPLKQK